MNPPRQRWLALGVLCLSLLAIVIDNTIVNVALPTLVRDLEADVAQLQWVVDAYTLVFAGLLLRGRRAGGPLRAPPHAADRTRRVRRRLGVGGLRGRRRRADPRPRGHGRGRRVHHARDALAADQRLHRRARARAGDRHLGRDGGARRRARPGGRRRPARPLLVGLDLHRQRPADRDRASSPDCGCCRSRATPSPAASTGPERRSRSPGSSPSCGRSSRRPRRAGRHRPCWPPARFAAVALVAFVVWQRRVAEPLLDVRLFRNPRFTAASTTVMVLFFALFGFLFLSTQYLQFVLGYSPSAAGVRVLPYAGAMIVFAPLSSALVARARHQARRHRGDAAVLARARRRGDDRRRAAATGGSPSRSC